MTSNLHAIRKDDHVIQALKQYQPHSSDEFIHTRFVHQSFTTTSLNDIDITTQLNTLTLSMPFFINAITGGSIQTDPINEKLAIVANQTGIAMATGSNSIAISQPNTRAGFKKIRQLNPNGLIFANLGAHHSLDHAKFVVDLLEANALQLHLNTPQELVMPEGDRNFSMWLNNIANIVSTLNVPVIVKEVGFGMSKDTISLLQQAGVSIVDISGRSGTNFITIENNRRTDKMYDIIDTWGISTLESLLEAKSLQNAPTIIASGGIKNAHDIAKCIALGANVVGLSAQFLYYIQKYGIAHTVQWIEQTKEQLLTIMTLLDAKNITQLQQKPLILAPSLRHWINERQLSI